MTAVGTRRIVLLARSSEYERLLQLHGTREQARFFLASRGQSIEGVEARHEAQEAALHLASAAIPVDARRARVERDELDRFLFEPDDIVVAVGQDGLVANAAKYLEGQPVVGLNPDPDRNPGVLVPHPPEAAMDLIADVAAGRGSIEYRCMVRGALDDGQSLVALNELFVGHRSHQSARYDIRWGTHAEFQSSSGLIVATGTGSTGWARSIHRERGSGLSLPRPCEPILAFFVREAWPSIATGTSCTEGAIGPAGSLEIVSRMERGGVCFGDGIEGDALELPWGAKLTIALAERRLALVV
ncbi:MAG: NAD(+)/NADH kinase [Planctomycetes bacterium]|nr:NAD(+)/NADH kinase [Planctomycetota bacterium]